MKKLMIAAAIVCAAALSQAATVNWQTTWLNASDGSYLDEAMAKGWAYNAIVTFDDGTEFVQSSTGLNDGYGQFTGSAPNGMPELTTHTAKLIVTETQLDGTVMTLTAEGVFDTFGESFPTELNFSSGMNFTSGSFIGDGTDKWQAVPEPTSGLLLLLGVAGLALRRRRA